MTDRIREIAGGALAVLAAVAALLAVTIVYVDRTMFDSGQFADRATDALDDSATRDTLSRAISDAIIDENPELIPSRPAIEFAAGAIIGNSSFEALFRQAAEEAHRVLFEEDGSVVLELGDAGQLIKAVVEASNPEIAEQLPPELETGLITVSEREFATETLDIAEGVSDLAFILPIVALALIAAAFFASVNRRRAVVVMGLSIAVALGVGLVALGVVRGLITDGFVEPAVAESVWDAYLSDLNTVLLLGIVGSIVIAAAAASLVFQYDVPDLARRLWARASRVPERPRWRVVWALLVGLIGITVALDPLSALKLVGVVVGVFLLFHAVTVLMDVIDESTSREHATEARGTFTGLVRGAIAVAVAIVLVVVGIGLLGGSSADAAQDIEACNGHAELCDRPVNTVSMAASHNSMSAAKDGFSLAMHDGGIIEQLDGGVRGLLIDTWYGIDRGGFVLTDLPASGVSEQEQAEVYGQETVDAAARLREGASQSGDRRTFMCHGWCELGALPLAEELGKIRAWMDDNPNEVIVIVIQDAISPEDTETALKEGGLFDLVYHHTPGQAFPTLRELIERGERAIVMAEKDSGAGELDWYLQAYDFTQETPFRALKPEDFTCRPDRGGTGKPFFLLNHWIEKTQPLASDAEIVNARDFLLDRARECETTRGVTPGLVAVNYWSVGDVQAVVDELNGVTSNTP